MRLHEYEAKAIFSANGLTIPHGGFAGNAEEAQKLATDIGLPVVIKSQVLVGGRGKAGGIVTAATPKEVEEGALRLLDLRIKGLSAAGVLVEKKLEIEHELYCGFAIDRVLGLPTLVLSSEGGVDIEEVRDPEKLVKIPLNVLEDLHSFDLIAPLKKIGLSGGVMLSVNDTVRRLYSVFRRFYALIAEVNPLVLCSNGEVCCVDAVLEMDDSALYRNRELLDRRMSGYSQRLQRLINKGSTFVPLEGNIGLICSGAGLGMATMDLIQDYPTLAPANFLETGGGITEELMADCMETILHQPGLQALLLW